MNKKALKKLVTFSIIFGITFTNVGVIKENNYVLQKTNNKVILSEIENNQDKFLDIINSNQTLKSEDKEKLVKFADFFLENPYLEEKYIIDKLNNVKIMELSNEYVVEVLIQTQRFVFGDYDIRENIIRVSKYGDALPHEMLHYLTDFYLTLEEKKYYIDNERNYNCVGLYDRGKNLGRAINEGMTELLNYEYFNYSKKACDSDMPYYKEATYVKMLCEIIDKDIVLNAYSNGNLDLIIEELAKIYGSKDNACDFISDIDHLNIIDDSHIRAIKYLNECYIVKTGKTLYENDLLNAYVKIVQPDGYDSKIIVSKAYFSDSYKKKIGIPNITKYLINKDGELAIESITYLCNEMENQNTSKTLVKKEEHNPQKQKRIR